MPIIQVPLPSKDGTGVLSLSTGSTSYAELAREDRDSHGLWQDTQTVYSKACMAMDYLNTFIKEFEQETLLSKPDDFQGASTDHLIKPATYYHHSATNISKSIVARANDVIFGDYKTTMTMAPTVSASFGSTQSCWAPPLVPPTGLRVPPKGLVMLA